MDKNFIDEARAASRGVLALLMGDRKAPAYFELSQSGLVGSFIAILLVTAVEMIMVTAMGRGGLFGALIQQVLPYAGLLGASALYLRQIGRSDALLPFVVAINWSNAVLSLVLLAVVLLGLNFVAIVVAVAVIVTLVNTARLVMTLRPLHVVLLILAQLAGVFAALLIMALLFPPTPEELAQVMSGAGNLPS